MIYSMEFLSFFYFLLTYGKGLSTSASKGGFSGAGSINGTSRAGEKNLTTLRNGHDISTLGQPEAMKIEWASGVNVQGLGCRQVVVN
jgi:hypothetical protein